MVFGSSSSLTLRQRGGAFTVYKSEVVPQARLLCLRLISCLLEREGKRETEAKKYKTEDEAASRGMRMFLGCSKKRNQSLTDYLLLKANTLRKLESDDRTTGRHSCSQSSKMHLP
jgi:hypothetical protein